MHVNRKTKEKLLFKFKLICCAQTKKEGKKEVSATTLPYSPAINSQESILQYEPFILVYIYHEYYL